jgi:integrase
MWRRINDTIELHGATSHVFRHTLGTILYETGTDIKTIQSVVGHADYSTTMNTYVHARDDRKQAAMAKINDQLSA